jgi:hypothetical protein
MFRKYIMKYLISKKIKVTNLLLILQAIKISFPTTKTTDLNTFSSYCSGFILSV